MTKAQVTNTGATTIEGDLELSPGTSVTGFPPGQVAGGVYVADGVALQAQTDLVTAYDDAAAHTTTTTSTLTVSRHSTKAGHLGADGFLESMSNTLSQLVIDIQ